MSFTNRTELLLSSDEFKAVQNAKICVFGVGGVGCYVVELLVRCGAQNITIVDFDKVDETNINRQIIATTKTVGELKVDAMKKRAQEINPKCNICAINMAFNEQNKSEFKLSNFDFVIDAIDSVCDKLLLIKECKIANVNIISAMGAGNKIDVPSFEICDIYKTQNDGLAKKMRKLLREEGITSLNVCYSKATSISNKTIGSIAYYPACAGSVIAGYVINQIIKGEQKWF